MNLEAAAIAKATNSSLPSVALALPWLLKAFSANDYEDARAIAGALATIAVESHFKLVTEFGPLVYFKRYENRKDLGNTKPGDGYTFRGRGWVQLTGRANYEKYEKELGLKLVETPDLLLLPSNSALVFTKFFKDNSCDIWSIRGNWRKVRKIYNGGLNGFDNFQIYVYNLLDLLYD